MAPDDPATTMAGTTERSTAFEYVLERSAGVVNDFQQQIWTQNTTRMNVCNRNFIYNPSAKVWAMQLDPVEQRFLLTGTHDSQLLLYDLHQLDQVEQRNSARGFDTVNRLPPVVHTRTSAPLTASNGPAPATAALSSNQPVPSPWIQQHRRQRRRGEPTVRPRQQAVHYGIGSVDWYPIDAGMFVSSCLDGKVQVWDSNCFEEVTCFDLKRKVFGARFSPIATSHTLIATCDSHGEIRLCDLSIGSSVQAFLGHQHEIWSLAWSNENEFQFVSGCRNGEIRLWDCRRSGSTACLLCFNQDGQAKAPERRTMRNHALEQRPPSSLAAAATTSSRSRLSQNRPSKKRRLAENAMDPHLAASYTTVRAHDDSIVSLCFTPDGRFLVSHGQDQTLRLWNSKTGEHLFVNYQQVAMQKPLYRGLTMAMAQEYDAVSSTVMYVPNGSEGQLNSYLVHSSSGRPLQQVSAHYRRISCCCYRKSYQELFTGGEDGLIMKWKAPDVEFDVEDSLSSTAPAISPTPQGAMLLLQDEQDAWSDDSENDEETENEAMTTPFIPPILR